MNLIINKGLKDMYTSVASIHKAVRYIASSPARLQKFRSCVKQQKIEYKGLLTLDTRWNSIYLMLETTIKFEKAFERYEEKDEKYLGHFKEDDNGNYVRPSTSED